MSIVYVLCQMIAPTSPTDYQPHIGETFGVSHGGMARTATLTLDSVTPKIDDEIQQCFVLLFSGQDVRLPQAIYRLSHPRLGEFDLFLVPIQSRKPGLLYEAVFNLLKESEQ